ncbi:hypothetical protein VTK56DRAFT_1356 [Thermocarpiscus australiensis]
MGTVTPDSRNVPAARGGSAVIRCCDASSLAKRRIPQLKSPCAVALSARTLVYLYYTVLHCTVQYLQYHSNMLDANVSRNAGPKFLESFDALSPNLEVKHHESSSLPCKNCQNYPCHSPGLLSLGLAWHGYRSQIRYLRCSIRLCRHPQSIQRTFFQLSLTRFLSFWGMPMLENSYSTFNTVTHFTTPQA